MKDVERLANIVRESMGDRAYQPFQPFVLYDSRLDTIRVVTKDCSWMEEPASENLLNILTVCINNHPETEGAVEYVGFAVESARAICRLFNLPDRGRVDVVAILDEFHHRFGPLDGKIDEMRRMLQVVGQHQVDITA